jgi:arabinan endo-1,5-alpha-L-arabinosidase
MVHAMPPIRNMFRTAILALLIRIALTVNVFALDGAIGIHDPSTVIKCDGDYYVFGTGHGLSYLISSNGFDWQRGGRVFDRIPDSVKSFVPLNDGSSVWAPDVIKVGDQYFVYYAVSKWGSFVSAVGLMSSPTLDTNSPECKWKDGGMVVHSSEGEDLNAIDPGVCLAPDGTLWLCYGSYHGNIELVQLSPQTGQRIATNSPVTIIANESEASEIINHDGWFYLFVNHGSCCQGASSTYNIRVGRAHEITGPYFDKFGQPMTVGGGTLFLAASGDDVGPGHFGLLRDDGVEKFSCHYEAVLGRQGRSVLDIRPLLWTLDGWPLPGEDVHEGIYQIRSLRTGTILEASDQTNSNEPAVHTGRYLIHDNQKWNITPAGNGFYKIIGERDTNALTRIDSTAGLGPFTHAEDQLWKIDQLSDGTYRIKSIAGDLALTALANQKPGNGTALVKFTSNETQRWVITEP